MARISVYNLSLQLIASSLALYLGVLCGNLFVTASIAAFAAHSVIASRSGMGAEKRHRFSVLAVVLLSGGLFYHGIARGVFDALHGLILLLCATLSLLAAWESRGEARVSWIKVAVFTGIATDVLFLIAGYSQNEHVTFFAGLLLALALCVVGQLVFRVPVWAKQVANTSIFFLIGLPLVNYALDRNEQDMAKVDMATRPYSFATSGGYPVIFKAWWLYYIQEMEQMGAEVYQGDRTGKFPFVLRPSSTGELFGASVRINSKGFRGREISEKKDAFRIVALGESTTFGLNIGTAPWPELLEERIAEAFPSKQPVEIINAGIPSYTLKHNLARLEKDILPLEPDLIISYHGVNGFPYIHKSLPPMHGALPPPYIERPMKLLADCEHRLKSIWHFRKHGFSAAIGTDQPIDPMTTEFAQHYRELISFAQTNSIALAISTFSMAVNSNSPAELVEFYRGGFPNVHVQMRANETHTAMVRELSREHPDLLLVDTQPGLDGCDTNFIDLIHFTGEGEERMTQAFFSGLEKFLARRLSDREPAVAARTAE